MAQRVALADSWPISPRVRPATVDERACGAALEPTAGAHAGGCRRADLCYGFGSNGDLHSLMAAHGSSIEPLNEAAHTGAPAVGQVLIELLRSRRGRWRSKRGASTSTQRSKRRTTQRTTIAGLFPSSCRLSSLGLVAVGGRMTPVCCPTGGGSVQ